MPPGGNRVATAAGVGLAAAYVAGVLLVDPFEERAIGCPVHELTGGWCPGCGATRASWFVLHGELGAAFRYNALLLPAVLFLVARWVHLAAPAATGWLPRWVRSPTEIRPAALVGAVGVVAAFTVARNLPALDWLAPPDA